jgi:hypothetical protein
MKHHSHGYAPVEVDEENGDDGTIDAPRFAIEGGSKQKENLWLLFIGFACGVLVTLGVGLCFNSYHGSYAWVHIDDPEQTRLVDQTDNKENAISPSPACSDDEATSPTIVSYSFLQTPRGLDLLQTLTNQLLEESPTVALRKLSELMKTDDQLNSSCHPLIHKLGRTAYEKLGFDAAVNLVMEEDPNLMRMCNAAYLHGTIENFLREKHPKTNDFLQANIAYVKETVCDKLDSVPLGQWECLHGIGHGILQHIRHQKLMESLQTSIKECHGDVTCENGIWMDHFASTSISSELDPVEAMQVCDLATERGRTVCLAYAPTEFLLHYPGKYKEAMTYCSTLREKSNTLVDVFTCVGGVGWQTAKEHMDDFPEIERICQSAPIDAMFKDECFDNALTYYKTATASDTVPARLCEDLDHFKDKCMKSASISSSP